MADLNLVPVFMIGLLGGVHCIGMCGGIVSAFSVASPQSQKRDFPIAVVAARVTPDRTQVFANALRVVAYNFGRIGSYMLAGALAGGVAQGARTFTLISIIQVGGYWLANFMLLALGLYLMNAWHGLARLEAAGQLIWRRVRPLLKYLLPMDSLPKAFALGGLWGWVPCGMVYSVLLTAMLTGSALHGAIVMAVFGLGTLPTLLSIGMVGTRLKTWSQRRTVRIVCGLIVLAFGILGLIRAANGLSLGWLNTLCLSPAGEIRR